MYRIFHKKERETNEQSIRWYDWPFKETAMLVKLKKCKLCLRQQFVYLQPSNEQSWCVVVWCLKKVFHSFGFDNKGNINDVA